MNRPAADYTLEDILSPHTLEERIYRLRWRRGVVDGGNPGSASRSAT